MAAADFSMRSQMRPDLWVQDHLVENCEACSAEFGFFLRRHHCRQCGHIFCAECSDKTFPLTTEDGLAKQEVRVCKKCFRYLATEKRSDKGSMQLVAAQRLEAKQKKRQGQMDKQAEADLLTAKSYCRGADMNLERALIAIGHRLPLDKSYYLIRNEDGKRESTMAMMTVPTRPQCPVILTAKSCRSHFRNLYAQRPVDCTRRCAEIFACAQCMRDRTSFHLPGAGGRRWDSHPLPLPAP